MSAREAVIEVAGSEPFRSLLIRLAQSNAGVTFLNKLSYPRAMFSSFDEAWFAARKTAYAGHDHPDYIKLHLELSKTLRPSDYAALYWIHRICSRDIRVFDFGGHVGNLFYSYLNYLVDISDSVKWTVFDLPKTVTAGRELAREKGTQNLGFTTSLAEYSRDQVLLISGAFHYWEKSIAEFVNQFPEPPEHIVINRTPVRDQAPAFFTVQDNGSYAVPCIVRSVNEVVSQFSALGYALIDRWNALELRLRMPLFPGLNVPYYSGFYFSTNERRIQTSCSL
jgi:putative methyltransferase (TIGR04325 family)